MKRLFLFLILILIFSVSAKSSISIESEFDLSFEYDSNISNLSEDDQQQFKDNEKPEKYELETIDDIILGFRYKLKGKYHSFKGHTQITSLGVNYDKYFNNEVYDNLNLSLQMRQYFSSKLYLELGYTYYPEIYLRNYKSELDDEYHQFDYGKNGWSSSLNWKLASNVSAFWKLDYSQLFYNKWFTEYDAAIVTNSIYVTWNPLSRFEAELRLARRSSTADAGEAYEDFSSFDGVNKDASYESNIFSINFKVRRLLGKNTLNIGYRQQQRFYSSNFVEDDYHQQRDDYIHKADASLYMPVVKKLRLIVKTAYEVRKTESPFQNVIDDKEYNKFTFSVNLSYDFKH